MKTYTHDEVWDRLFGHKPWYKRAWCWARRLAPIWWLRYHVWPSNRYHVLDLRNEWYDFGWCDVDHRMLYACFALLKFFVEREAGLDMLRHQGSAIRELTDDQWGGTSEEREAEAVRRDYIYNEVRELYQWWTVDRAKEINADAASGFEKIDELYEKETKQLLRLVVIRSGLWT